MTVGLAFDQSTTICGWAAGTETTDPIFGKIVAPKRDNLAERGAFIMKDVDALILRIRPDVIAIEKPFIPFDKKPKIAKVVGGRSFFPPTEQDEDDDAPRGAKLNPATLEALLGVAFTIRILAASHSIPCEVIAPSTWRRTFLDVGRAPREEQDKAKYMKRLCRRRCSQLGYEVSNDDEAEAIGILFDLLHGKRAAEKKQASFLDAL